MEDDRGVYLLGDASRRVHDANLVFPMLAAAAWCESSRYMSREEAFSAAVDQSGIVGSAYALAKDIIRGTRCGLWIESCATSDQILRFHEGDDLVLSIAEMNNEIEAAYQGDPLFGEL